MDRSGWIDAKTHRRDGACSASVSSDSSASEVLVLISIAQTSPSQLQAQNSSNNIICWRGDLRPKSPLFPSATLHCSSLSLSISLSLPLSLSQSRILQHHTSRPGRGRVGNHDPAMAGSRAPAVTQAPKRRAMAGSGALGLGWVSGVLRS